MLSQRSPGIIGCDAILNPANHAVVLAACTAALKLRTGMTLYGKPEPEALKGVLFNHLDQPEPPGSPVAAVCSLAMAHLAPAYVEPGPATDGLDNYGLFGVTFASAFLLTDIRVVD